MGRLKNVRRKILASRCCWERRNSMNYISFTLAPVPYLIITLNLVKLERSQFQSEP